MLPGIADFFSKTFTENITKLLQPAGLIGSSLFLILNLLFIFPGLVDKDVPLAVSILNLSSALQIVLAVSMILLVAYLLLSFQNSMLKLLTGEVWADSPFVGRFFIRRHKAIRKSLDAEMQHLQDQEGDLATQEQRDIQVRRLTVGWRLYTHYPQEEEYIVPTALGNVLNAISSYLWNHYRTDMTALWPYMKVIIANDKVLGTSLDNEKTTLDFLVSLTFLLALFAIEIVLCQFFLLRQGLPVLWAALPLVLAFIVYQATVRQARTWGDLVQMAFDTHRDDLRKALGVRPFRNVEDEQDVWSRISGWLPWGTRADDVFSEQSALPAPTITTSESVKVTLQSTITDTPDTVPDSPMPAIRKTFQTRQYVMLVNIAGTQHDSSSSHGETSENEYYILVSDPRVPLIETAPLGKDWNGTKLESPKIIRSSEVGAADQLLWHIKTNPPNGSLIILYSLPGSLFTASTNRPECLEITESDESATSLDITDTYISYKFLIRNKGDADIDKVLLEVRDDRIAYFDAPTGTIQIPDQKDQTVSPERLSPPDRYLWPLEELGIGESMTFTYTATVKKGEI